MGGPARVIHEVKARLLLERFAESLLGGIDVHTPPHIRRAQLVLAFCLAGLVGLGAVIPRIQMMNIVEATGVLGSTMGGLLVVLHLSAPILFPPTETVLEVYRLHDLGAPRFHLAASPYDALVYLCMQKRPDVAFFHAVVGAAALGIGTLTLTPAAAVALPSAPVLCEVAWFCSLYLAILPLFFARKAAAAGTNVAFVGKGGDRSGLARASRALYATACCALMRPEAGVVAAGVGGCLLAALPFIWPAASLPHLRVLLSWALEQWLVLAHGGSACASDERALLALALALVGGLGVGVAYSYDSRAGITVAAGLGQLLALPLPPFFKPTGGGGGSGGDHHAGGGAADDAKAAARAGLPGARARRLALVAELALAVGGCGFGGATVGAYAAATGSRETVALATELGVGGLWVCHAASAHLQRPLLLRGLARNPLFERPAVLAALRWAHARLTLLLAAAGAFCVSAHVAFDAPSNNPPTEWPSPLVAGATALLLSRALRWAWQAPARASLELAAYLLLQRAVISRAETEALALAARRASGEVVSAAQIGGLANFATLYKSQVKLPTAAPLVLLAALPLAALFHDRLRRFAGNVHVQLALLRALRSGYRGDRFKHSATLLATLAVGWPAMVAVAAAAAALAAPVLPVLGLPIFVVGYPRPARFWPTSGLSIEPSLGGGGERARGTKGFRRPRVKTEPVAAAAPPATPERAMQASRPAAARAAAAAAPGLAGEAGGDSSGSVGGYAALADELITTVLPRALADGSLHGGSGGGAGSLFLTKLGDGSILAVQVVESGYRHATLIQRGFVRASPGTYGAAEAAALDRKNGPLFPDALAAQAPAAAVESTSPPARARGDREEAADSDSDRDDDDVEAPASLAATRGAATQLGLRDAPLAASGGDGGADAADAADAAAEEARQVETALSAVFGAYAPLAAVRMRSYALRSEPLPAALRGTRGAKAVSRAFALSLVHALRAEQRARARTSGGLPSCWWELIRAHAADTDAAATAVDGDSARARAAQQAEAAADAATDGDEDADATPPRAHPPPSSLFPYSFDQLVCAELALDPAEVLATPPRTAAVGSSPLVVELSIWLHGAFARGAPPASGAAATVRTVATFCDAAQLADRSRRLDALAADEPELLALAVRAYRAAVKLVADGVLPTATTAARGGAAVDASARGAASSYEAAAYGALAEIADPVQWHVGPPASRSWALAAKARTRGLFGLRPARTAADGGVGKAAVERLQLRELDAAVGAWSADVVCALWAALQLDLLFAGNDDERRYGARPHGDLLRALAAQAAAPPLGAAAFSAAPRLCEFVTPLDDLLACTRAPAPRPRDPAAVAAARAARAAAKAAEAEARAKARRRVTRPPQTRGAPPPLVLPTPTLEDDDEDADDDDDDADDAAGGSGSVPPSAAAGSGARVVLPAGAQDASGARKPGSPWKRKPAQPASPTSPKPPRNQPYAPAPPVRVTASTSGLPPRSERVARALAQQQSQVGTLPPIGREPSRAPKPALIDPRAVGPNAPRGSGGVRAPDSDWKPPAADKAAAAQPELLRADAAVPPHDDLGSDADADARGDARADAAAGARGGGGSPALEAQQASAPKPGESTRHSEAERRSASLVRSLSSTGPAGGVLRRSKGTASGSTPGSPKRASAADAAADAPKPHPAWTRSESKRAVIGANSSSPSPCASGARSDAVESEKPPASEGEVGRRGPLQRDETSDDLDKLVAEVEQALSQPGTPPRTSLREEQ